MNRIFSLIISLIAIATASAQTNLSMADSLYFKGHFLEALQLYEQAEQLEGTSAALLYNMGNAALKANRYGSAMVAYQRAAAIDPGNSRIRHNIDYLQGKIDDRNTAKLGTKKGDMNQARPTSIAAFWQAITAHINPDTWGWLALATFIITLAGVITYLLVGNVLIRKIGFFSAIVAIVLCVLFNIFAMAGRRHWNDRRECVVTAFEATISPKPDAEAKPEFTPIVAGTLLSMPEPETEAPAGWVYVRLNGSVAGWLPSSDLTIL